MNTSFAQFDTLTNISCEQEEFVEINRTNNDNTNSSSINNEDFRYPVGFAPRDSDVIVGKGMNCYNHFGNKMLRNIVASRLRDYAMTTCKKEKSNIVSSIIGQVRKNGGAFIKKDHDTGLWFDADNFLARDKISQTFRNILYQERKKNRKRREKFEYDRNDQVGGVCNEGVHDFDATKTKEEAGLNQIQTRRPLQMHVPLDSKKNTYFQDNKDLPRSFSSSPNLDVSFSDTELYYSLERYAISLPDEILEQDSNPYEPDPIRLGFS